MFTINQFGSEFGSSIAFQSNGMYIANFYEDVTVSGGIGDADSGQYFLAAFV